MPGLAAGSLGAAETVLTDHVAYMAKANLDSVLDDENLSARSSLWGVRVKRLSWGDATVVDALEPPLDLILGADLLYRESEHDALAATIVQLSGPSTVVLFASPSVGDPHGEGYNRCLDGACVGDNCVVCSDGAPFFATMRKLGFDVVDIAEASAVQDAIEEFVPPPGAAERLLQYFTRHAAGVDVRVTRMRPSRVPTQRVVSVKGKLEVREGPPKQKPAETEPAAANEPEAKSCVDAPCLNGGACTDESSHGSGSGGFRCACAEGWEGERCGYDVDECASTPCLNAGECYDSLTDFSWGKMGYRSLVYGLKEGEYRCSCTVGWEGGNCQSEDGSSEM